MLKILIPVIGLGGLAATAVVVLIVVFVLRAWWGLPLPILGYGEGPDQPIAFPHTVHVEQIGLDCTFCHRNVTKGATAGIPPVQQCMFCHIIAGDGKPEVEKLRTAFANEQPIDWVRVHRLPDHVRFIHEAHISFFSQKNNIEPSAVCSTCHGDVGGMTKVKQVRSLKMGDCVNCHRDYDAPTDCLTCHY
ncbi:MAG: cytochrome c3 family protein [Chloroflexi bacterium]|nr:cytochrome c3 family protein [Chloroflexota bacterium]